MGNPLIFTQFEFPPLHYDAKQQRGCGVLLLLAKLGGCLQRICHESEYIMKMNNIIF